MPTFITHRSVSPRRTNGPTIGLPASQETETPVSDLKISFPESTSNPAADAPGEKSEVPSYVDPKPVHTIESSSPSEDKALMPAKDSSLSTSPTVVKSGDHIDLPEDPRAPSPSKEDLPHLSEGNAVEVVKGQREIEEHPGINKHEPDLDLLEEEPIESDKTVNVEVKPKVLTTEPCVAEGKLEKQPEEGDEVTRGARNVTSVVKSSSLGTPEPFERISRKEEPPVEECPSPAKTSTSTVDPKEMVGQGIGSKERMAALRGKNGFSSARPPPKPMTNKPTWKPPQKPVNPPLTSERKAPVDFEAPLRSPPLDSELTETLPKKPTDSEERQRRTVTSAHVQRLGPPAIAPKPLIRRPEVPKEDAIKSGTCYIQSIDEALLTIDGTELASPPSIVEDLLKENCEPLPEGTPLHYPCFHVVNKALDSKVPADKPVRSDSTSRKPSTSMHIPVAPRRPAPPRPKKTPKISDESPTKEGEVLPEADIPLPESTSVLFTGAEGVQTEVPPNVDLKPVPTMKQSIQAKDESLKPVENLSLVTDRSTFQTIVKSGDHDDVSGGTRAPSPPKDWPAPLLSEEKLANLVKGEQGEIEERSRTEQSEQGLEEPLAEVTKTEEPPKLDATVDGEDEPNALTTEPDTAEDIPKEQPEEEGSTEVTYLPLVNDNKSKGSIKLQQEGTPQTYSHLLYN